LQNIYRSEERYMIVVSKRVFTVICLLVTTNVLVQAQSTVPGTAMDAASRINTAFDAADAMPPVEPVNVPMAIKGDLPVPPGCLALQADEHAECMDAAYELPSEPSIVMETRFGNHSILSRMNIATRCGSRQTEARVK
jgi:hypothetical protein